MKVRPVVSLLYASSAISSGAVRWWTAIGITIMTTSVESAARSQALACVRPAYIIGQDADGHWLALEAHGHGGGFFRDRAAAVRFAGFETGHRAEGVRFASHPLSLAFAKARPIVAESVRQAA